MITNTTRPTVEVLEALKVRLQALRWKTEPAFHAVELFDLADLVAALKSLLIAKSRACVIVHDGDDFEHEVKGNDLHVYQTRSVLLLLTDKIIGDRKAAAMGGIQNPGIYTLADLVVPAVTGPLFENPKGLYMVPLRGDSLEINDKEVVGRTAYMIPIELHGGELRVSLGRTPIV